jgi:hypothetical protein
MHEEVLQEFRLLGVWDAIFAKRSLASGSLYFRLSNHTVML